jgi:Mg2+/citrate symporter
MSDESNNKKQDFWVELSFIMLCGLVLLILFSMALGFRDSETVYVFEDTTYILDELHKEESFTYEPEQDRIKLKLLDDENCLVKRSFDNVKVYIIK